MKKLISLVLAGLMMFALLACSEPEKTVVYVGNIEGVEIEYSMLTQGDKVKSIVQTMVTDVSQIEEETLDSAIAAMESEYNGILGVTYTATKSGTELHEKITMDFSSKSKIKAISELGIIDTENADYVSLKSTIKNLKAQGLTEK